MNKDKVNIEKFIENSNSLDVLRAINERILERNFHEQTHILYDIANYIGNSELKYLEIGSYVGSSASLMLENTNVSKVFCIDPLSLPINHFRGKENQESTLRKNLSYYPKEKYFIHKGYSIDDAILSYFKDKDDFFDIIFIDGDHRYDGVLSDYFNFNSKLKSGGFLIFDDYFDHNHSPEVKKAVDYLCTLRSVNEKYDLVGTLKGPLSKYLGREYGEFIMRKK